MGSVPGFSSIYSIFKKIMYAGIWARGFLPNTVYLLDVYSPLLLWPPAVQCTPLWGPLKPDNIFMQHTLECRVQ
jgi:hypothetical protein